jgi:SAM-dependent methyltransferase
VDRARIESFLDHFIELAAGATTVGLLAIADRSGLSAYLAAHPGETAGAIADGANLNERYVREILSGLAAAGVVEYAPDAETFTLPPEHALFLVDETSPYFMGGFLDMIPSGLTHIDDLTNATRHGGGIRFDEFGTDMVRGIARGNAPSQRAFLIGRWLPGVPGLVERLATGIRVADIGCGSGTAAISMAAAYPESSITGFDTSSESISRARSEAGDLPNLEFVQAAVSEIPLDPGFGFITSFDVIHDLADPLGGLERVRMALVPDGLFLMMEPNLSSDLSQNLNPRGSMMYGISTMHCLTQSLAVGGAGLGAAWGREAAEQMAVEAGFSSFEPVEAISNRFSAFYLLKA